MSQPTQSQRGKMYRYNDVEEVDEERDVPLKQEQDEDDDEPEGDPLEEHAAAQAAQADDIPRPLGLVNKLSPNFGLLTAVLEYFEGHLRNRHKQPADKHKMLDQFFTHLREHAGKDLYPLVRLLLPDRDNRRRNYSLKETKLSKALIKAMDLPAKSDAAIALERWKIPPGQSETRSAAGEFSAVAFSVIQPRSTVIQEFGYMTIDDVNDALDALTKTTFSRFAPAVQGEQAKKGAPRVLEKQAKILKECIAKMTALEMKWFIRIILRDLKVGVSERTVFGALHPDAMHLFNTCSDIKKVCWTLWDTGFRLLDKQKDVSLFGTFKPMLSWRATRGLSSIVKTMQSNRSPALSRHRNIGDARNPYWCGPEEFLIEEKLDGERMQLHKKGRKYKYFSRKSTEYTYAYGKSPEEGSLTPFIHDLFAEGVEEIILDGEMLVWDPNLQKSLPFGTLKSFITKEHFGPWDPRPCFKVFDILYIRTPASGPQTFLSTPLFERKGLLQQVFTPVQGVIELVDVGKGTTTKDMTKQLKKVVEERGEGLVIKHPWSNYHLGGRESVWVKLKPDYMDELAESISGMVIGAYWGEGRRGGRHSSFLIGLRDDSKPIVDGEPHYQSFCKVGTGFDAGDYDWLIAFAGKWQNFDRKKLPTWFSTVNEFPDQLIKPSESFVIEIKAAEIVAGKDYACGMTLRFPRAKFIFKQEEDQLNKLQTAFSLETVRDLTKKDKRMSGKEDLSSRRKSKFAKTSSKPLYISKPITEYENKSEIFKGLKFYVHNLKHLDKSRDYIDKNALQKLILEHGGDYIQKIPDTSVERVVIASEWKGVHNKAGVKDVDVLLESWVLESIQQGRRLPKVKRFYVRALPATEVSAEYNAMEEEESLALHQEIDEGDDDEFEPESEPESDIEPLLDPEPDNSTIETAFAAMQLKPQVEVAEDEATRRRNRWEDESDNAASSESEPETEEEFDDGLTDANPGMGAGNKDLHYDPDVMFNQIVAYFDLSELAQKNGLEMPRGNVAEADKHLLEARAAFTSNGGVATDMLLDPDLTHIVVNTDLDNEDRRKMMIRLTFEPRIRKMVTYLWITESVEGAELGGSGPFEESAYKG